MICHIFLRTVENPIDILEYIIEFTGDINLAVCLNMCIEKIYKPILHTYGWAICYSTLEVVKWLYTKKHKSNKNLIDIASQYGKLKIVKWAHFNTKEKGTIDAVDYASLNGHIEVVKWLLDNDYEFTDNAITWSVSRGHYEIYNLLTNHNLYKYNYLINFLMIYY